MKTLLALLLAAPLLVPPPLEQRPAPRPKILGVAHLAVFVSDLPKARAFYRDLLGLEEPFTLPKADGSVEIAFVKIDDHQWIELFNRPNAGEGQLNHVAIYTDSADAIATTCRAGVAVPERVGKGRTGNKNFIERPRRPRRRDRGIPSGQLDREGRWASHAGAALSEHAIHVGVLVGNLEASLKFYNGVLGFQEFWRGSAATSKTLSWVNMRVPEARIISS